MKMKKIIIAGTLLISIVANAQKDELKTLKKIYSKDTPTASDVATYKETLARLEPLATEEADKVYYNYYKGVLPQMELALLGTAPNPMQLQNIFTPKAISELANVYNATLEYEKKSGKKVFTDDITKDVAVVKPILVNAAVKYGDLKKYNEAADILYSVYLIDKKDQEKLYYAANYAVNANNYDTALKYYQELKAQNYSGEGTLYYAINKSTKQEEYFDSKEHRETFIKLGTHEKPHDEKVESKRGEIYKNIALILVSKDKKEEAKQAFADARKANPDDNSLLINEANLYLDLKDTDTYTRLVNEALQKEPNNPDLVFNLGVLSANANKLEIAETYYRKAIEIDANYFNAYLNLAELKLRGDQKYVDEINKLGTSEKELKRYEVLKAERNKNFLTVLPLLEKAYELKPNDEPAKKTLLSVYNALEMTDKYKALKAKM
jgi:tetratricopeptide (TPR) repeat protein